MNTASFTTVPCTSSSPSVSALEHTLVTSTVVATDVLTVTETQDVGTSTSSASSHSPSSRQMMDGNSANLNGCESLLGVAVGLPIMLALVLIGVFIAASMLILREKR